MDFRNSTTYYPLGIRSNNPLNISGTGWQGQVGTASNPQKEAIFIDTQHGLRAAAILLYNYYKKYNLNNIRAIINRWAPADDPNANNQPQLYAEFVGRRTGIDPDQPFELNASNIKAIMIAMFEMEQGLKYADLIPNSEYDEAIKMANRSELLIQAGKIGGLILLLVFSYFLIKKVD